VLGSFDRYHLAKEDPMRAECLLRHNTALKRSDGAIDQRYT